MRLIVSLLVLALTALDSRYGRPSAVLQVVGVCSAMLLILSLIIDRVFPADGERPVRPQSARNPEWDK